MTRRTVKGMPGMMDPMNDQNVPMPSQSERLMMLLEQSMQKKQQEAAQAEQDIGAAKDKEFGATVADGSAKLLAALANRNRTGQAYFNRMQDLGKAPQMTDPGSFKYEGDLQGAAEKNTMSAQQKLEQLKAQMQEGLKQRMGLAGQLDKAAFDQAESQRAQSNADRAFDADQKYKGEMLGLKKQEVANSARSKNAYADMADQLRLKGLQLDVAKKEKDLELQNNPKANPKAIQEANYRADTMLQNLDKLKNIVKESGTFEAFGPESSQMDSLIFNIAVDYAKLVDPESVAREGEVAAAQKYMLPVKGLFVRNSTAETLIDEMKANVNQRKQNLSAQTTPQAGGQDQEALAWARANPNDPRAQQILKLNGGK